MGNKQTYLKSKNVWWLRLFLLLNLSVFLSVSIGNQLSLDTVDRFWYRLTLKDGFIALLFPLLTIILNGLIGDQWKARLVFWRWHYPLPGCRAFTEIMLSDPRINVQRLRICLSPLPVEPNEQNATWYRLYKKHSDRPAVKEAHQTYLLTRDLTALAALCLLFFATGSLIASVQWSLRGIYYSALLVQYVLIATSARNYGCRFAANVLTEESHVYPRGAASTGKRQKSKKLVELKQHILRHFQEGQKNVHGSYYQTVEMLRESTDFAAYDVSIQSEALEELTKDKYLVFDAGSYYLMGHAPQR